MRASVNWRLVGVLLGAGLAILKDFLFHRQKTKKEYEYLCIRVAGELDRFSHRCVDVVQDDGTIYGQYDKDGCARVRVKTPEFKPYELDVNWKSLPHDLMYEVLQLPNMIESANESIESVFDHVACPPYYEEGFEERQLKYSNLGIYAIELANKLRGHAKLPLSDTLKRWGPMETFNMKKEKIKELQHKRGLAQKKLIENYKEDGGA